MSPLNTRRSVAARLDAVAAVCCDLISVIAWFFTTHILLFEEDEMLG